MERQSLLKEFGDSQNLQYLIDTTQERFAPVLWGNFFQWRDVSTITFETVIGDYANAAAASVVSYDSAAPLRTRRAIRKLVGEIPSIREKFRMTEKDLQEYLKMRGEAGAAAILRLIFDDVQQAAEAPHRRLDIFALEALSTGEIVLNTTTNPDGIVTESNVDFGMPSANKVICQGAVWSAGGATATPITDIMYVVELAETAGVTLDRILMRRSTFNNFRKADEVVNYVSNWKIGRMEAEVNLRLDLVNEFLIAEGLPKIVLVEASIPVEKDGIPVSYNPWSQYAATFVPAGLMGDMNNAPIVERLFPVKQVAYAEYNRVLIKKWSETDPVAEFTACELNAFPSWKNVEHCWILDTNST